MNDNLETVRAALSREWRTPLEVLNRCKARLPHVTVRNVLKQLAEDGDIETRISEDRYSRAVREYRAWK